MHKYRKKPKFVNHSQYYNTPIKTFDTLKRVKGY